MCFHCQFWIQHLTKPSENRIITPQYEHFVAASWSITAGEARRRGFGGAYWRAEFLDGTVKFTNDLWSQGTIDELWRPRFTPNVKELKSISRNDLPYKELTNA